MRPYSAKMFPHSVVAKRTSWTPGRVPSLKPDAVVEVTLDCNVQASTSDADPTYLEANAMGSRRYFKISFPADPILSAQDALVWEGLDLVVLSSATPVARGQLWRLIASVVTP